MILPTSYTLSSSLLNIGPRPVASGGSGDVYKGTLDRSLVCIKRVRVYSKDGPAGATKVHHRSHHFPPCTDADETLRRSTKRLSCGNA